MRVPVIVLRHGDGEPVFDFVQRQTGSLVAVITSPLAHIGKRRAGQPMHETHQRADHALDHAAEMWPPGWAPFDVDAVLGAAALECCEWNSDPLSTPSRRGLPRTGQVAATRALPATAPCPSRRASGKGQQMLRPVPPE